MFKLYLVEDETPAMQRLQDLLSMLPGIDIIGQTDSGKEAIEQINTLKPDVVILDIHINDISGIDVLPLLTHRPVIIFTTAYDQYAVQAFEQGAVDYLLKPFSADRLKAALARAREKHNAQSAQLEEIHSLLRQIQNEGSSLRKIPSKTGEKVTLIDEDDIVYINAEDKLVFVHTTEKKWLVNYTLDELQKRLDDNKFFRIHRATIANLSFVKTINTWMAGGYKIIMGDKDKTHLTVSRTAGKTLRQKLGW
jgi:DNA-binding LytR/AlgR family response regulator